MMGTAMEVEDSGGGGDGSGEEEEEEEEERGRRSAVFEAGEKRLRERALMTWPIMERPDHVNPRVDMRCNHKRRWKLGRSCPRPRIAGSGSPPSAGGGVRWLTVMACNGDARSASRCGVRGRLGYVWARGGWIYPPARPGDMQQLLAANNGVGGVEGAWWRLRVREMLWMTYFSVNIMVNIYMVKVILGRSYPCIIYPTFD
ncbi:hypothetical protein Droror1_Dr00006327 [Drosera rotundifolia]